MPALGQVNILWSQCEHLGAGLMRELEVKHNIVRRLAREGKHGRTRFISAEGCYSWVVANAPKLRVKFAAKAFADWSNDPEFYVVDGAVRKCRDPSLVWEPALESHTCNPFGPRLALHSVRLDGVQRALGAPMPVQIHADCSRWVEERFRLCANLSQEDAPLSSPKGIQQ